jgi:hypothetical protein
MATEIEAAIQALPSAERERLADDLPSILPELNGDMKWQHVFIGTRPRPALAALGDEIAAQFKKAVCWLVISLFFIGRLSQAELLVSSLGNTSSYVNVGKSVWIASPFQLSTQSWVFSSATIDLAVGSIYLNTADVYLFSDNTGQPGTPLAYLGSQIINGSQTYTFPTSQTVRLDPLTTYWIGVGNTSTNGGLNISLSLFGDFTFTNVSGATMTYSASDGTGSDISPPQIWNPSGSDVALLYAVDGIPVKLSEPYFAGIQAINGACSLMISNLQSGQIIVLEVSTNLISWTSLQTNIASGTTLSFTNGISSQVPCQFFRASAQ